MLKKNIYFTALLISFALISLQKKEEPSLSAISNIISKSNSDVSGTVSFTEINGVVSMTAKLTGLTPGDHAIHIHAIGDCSAADGTSAGGHWNPTFTIVQLSLRLAKHLTT